MLTRNKPQTSYFITEKHGIKPRANSESTPSLGLLRVARGWLGVGLELSLVNNWTRANPKQPQANPKQPHAIPEQPQANPEHGLLGVYLGFNLKQSRATPSNPGVLISPQSYGVPHIPMLSVVPSHSLRQSALTPLIAIALMITMTKTQFTRIFSDLLIFF